MAPRAYQLIYSGGMVCDEWVVEDSCHGFYLPFSFRTEDEAFRFGVFALYKNGTSPFYLTLAEMQAIHNRFFVIGINQTKLYLATKLVILARRMKKRCYTPGARGARIAQEEFQERNRLAQAKRARTCWRWRWRREQKYSSLPLWLHSGATTNIHKKLVSVHRTQV